MKKPRIAINPETDCQGCSQPNVDGRVSIFVPAGTLVAIDGGTSRTEPPREVADLPQLATTTVAQKMMFCTICVETLNEELS